MSKQKLNFEKKIKLSGGFPRQKESSLEIIRKSTAAKTTSFRLRDIDIDRLEKVLQRVNERNITHPINRTTLLKGLIQIATKYSEEAIIKAIKDSL